jgi:hypothetical protein
MRWTWTYLGALFSSPLSKLAGALVTIAPLAVAIFFSDKPFLWLFLVAAFLVVVQAWHAYRSDRSAPQLRIGEPVIGSLQPINAPAGTGWNEWQNLGCGCVVRVPATNAQGAGEARSVYGELRFTGEEDDFDLRQQGRWRDAPEKPEINIPGNERPYELDLFVHFPAADMDDRTYVWNQQSLAAGVKHDDYRIRPPFFRIEVILRGSHSKPNVRRAWRVWARGLPRPEIVPVDELFPVERAIQEAEDAESESSRG